MIKTVFLFIYGLVAWIAIGSGILALIDDDDQSLFKWARECPLGGVPFVILFWPVFTFMWLKYLSDDKE